jgi:hypothetical protein
LRWEVLKGDFESDWAAFKELNKDPGHKVAWCRQWLVNKLADASEDVWKEVAEYMKAEVPSEQEGSEVERYQRCVATSWVALTGSQRFASMIDLLPRTLALWCRAVQAKTGLNVLVLLGGPIPKLNGTIETLQ